MYENDPGLTREHRALLWTLVRKEAMSLGYGKHYTEMNQRTWPRKLRELRTIARKLRN